MLVSHPRLGGCDRAFVMFAETALDGHLRVALLIYLHPLPVLVVAAVFCCRRRCRFPFPSTEDFP